MVGKSDENRTNVEIEISDSKFNYEYKLAEKGDYFKVVVSPPGVSIYIDNTINPSNVYLEYGLHSFKIEKFGYLTKRQTLYLNGTSDKTINFTLRENPSRKIKTLINDYIENGEDHSGLYFGAGLGYLYIPEEKLRSYLGGGDGCLTYSLETNLVNFPWRIDLSYKGSYTTEDTYDFADSSTFHAFDIFASLYAFNIAEFAYVYAGLGLELSWMTPVEEGDWDYTTLLSGRSSYGMSSPFFKAGLELDFGSFMFFGEYSRYFFPTNGADHNILNFGISLKM